MLLKDKLKDRTLILASASPRRREILTASGLPFTLAEPYAMEEIYPAGMPARQVPEYLARMKSEAYPTPLAEGEIVMTADTVVILDGEIFGKPQDRDDALRMLTRLSGREHVVITGVCLRDAHRMESFSSGSRVAFRPLAAEEIVHYVDTYNPMDKAGAYAIQEWIGYVGVKGVKGSFYNVMGLPMQMIYTRLDNFIG